MDVICSFIKCDVFPVQPFCNCGIKKKGLGRDFGKTL